MLQLYSKEHFDCRSELAVMEIFDSGLLGEGVLTTLQHAWKELLVHSKLPDVGVRLGFPI